MCQKSRVIYIGESGQTFGDTIREHLRAPSPIHQQSQSTGHPVDLECFTLIDKGVTGDHQDHKRIYVHPSK